MLDVFIEKLNDLNFWSKVYIYKIKVYFLYSFPLEARYFFYISKKNLYYFFFEFIKYIYLLPVYLYFHFIIF